jgi:hypothetical protein
VVHTVQEVDVADCAECVWENCETGYCVSKGDAWACVSVTVCNSERDCDERYDSHLLS